MEGRQQFKRIKYLKYSKHLHMVVIKIPFDVLFYLILANISLFYNFIINLNFHNISQFKRKKEILNDFNNLFYMHVLYPFT